MRRGKRGQGDKSQDPADKGQWGKAVPSRKDRGAAGSSRRRDSLKSPHKGKGREEAGSSTQKVLEEPGAHHPGRAGRMRTPVPTDQGCSGVRTQAERTHSQRLKAQVRNWGSRREPGTGEGSDNNSHFTTVHAWKTARTTPTLFTEGRVSREVPGRPAIPGKVWVMNHALL